MSTLNVNTVQSSTSNPPIFKNSGGTVAGTLCRAWVNFDGTGTITIRDSFNVSSITDNGTGDYTINFTNEFANTNYCVSGTAADLGVSQGYRFIAIGGGYASDFAKTNSSMRIHTVYDPVNTSDCEQVTVVFHS